MQLHDGTLHASEARVPKVSNLCPNTPGSVGHDNLWKTCRKLTKVFAWKKMNKDVAESNL